MATSEETTRALAYLSKVEAAKKKVSDRLHVAREAAIARGDTKTQKAITQHRKELGQAQLRIVNAKLRIQSSQDISGALGRLKSLSSQADGVVADLTSLAKVLGAFADIIRILKALSGAFA